MENGRDSVFMSESYCWFCWVFVLAVSPRNGAVNTYNLVHRFLRLPTFCIIPLKLLFVLFRQLFGIMSVRGDGALVAISDKKIVFTAGVSCILLHRLEVCASVPLWPKMTNNDVNYFSCMTRMLGTLVITTGSLTKSDPVHYAVACCSGSVFAMGTSMITRFRWRLKANLCSSSSAKQHTPTAAGATALRSRGGMVGTRSSRKSL
ncbi:hypothetical protein BBJ28_00016752 [Nothophytophthora sp. Chile5]|nr:hypothetical protein BBJ28_00016752 [Nothophytophthora sp. Chile5]